MQKLLLAAMIAATTLTSLLPTMSTAQDNNPSTARPPRHEDKPSSDNKCGTKLGYLRQVFPEQIAVIDTDYRVWVTEICLNSEYGLLRSQGNAGKLRGAIADNEVLVGVLDGKAYGPEDVVGVRMMGDDTINLYVHPFHH